VNLRKFADVCKIVNGMRNCRVGTIGSRITSFKTVRVDEITLQKYGIINETFDLTEVILRVNKLHGSDPKVAAKKLQLENFADFNRLPAEKFETLAKLAVAFDDLITANKLNCFSLRCWTELQRLLGVSACALTSELSCRGIPVACEGDTLNAVTLYAIRLATGNPTVCLDWNNNYNHELDRCVIAIAAMCLPVT
jgi:L-fucose isomerase-like protein